MSDQELPQDEPTGQETEAQTSEDMPEFDATEEETLEPAEIAKVELSPQNVEVRKEPLGTDKHETSVDHTLSLMNLTPDEFNALVEAYPRLNALSGKEGQEWLMSLSRGVDHMMNGGSLNDSLSRDGSKWRQSYNVEGDELGIARPRLQSKEGGSVLSGERALLRATNMLGMGATIQVPLWHSGIWVTLRAPSDGALLELDRRISNEKITLGRHTSGMLFSNTMIYTQSFVVNFILAHIQDATVRDNSPEALRRMIRCTDIPTLIWGLVCTIYPNGYPFSQPCTVDPSKCLHVVKTTLSISKLSWTDNTALSEEQRRHMQKRNTKHTEEQIMAYQERHRFGNTETKTITDDLRVVLEVPSIERYQEAGFAWVDGIAKMVEDSFGVSLKGEERDAYILDQGRLTALRQYSHWISRVEMGDDSVEDRETIEALMGTFSSEDSVSTPIFEEVGKYIDRSTISLIGLPKYNCPECGGKVGDHDETHRHILPLDMVTIFFTLLDQRIYKALTKQRL